MPHPLHRDRIISIRLTAAEANDLTAKAAAAGVGLSDYVRHAVAGTPIPERRRARGGPSAAASPAVLAALARAGNNLNQIARWAQVHKGAMSAVAVVSALLRLERSLAGLAAGDEAAAGSAPASPSSGPG